MRKYNKNSCHSCIRQVLVLDEGKERIKIIVAGQHAFSWSITVISKQGAQSLILPNRLSCLQELTKCKQQYRNHGTIRIAV